MNTQTLSFRPHPRALTSLHALEYPLLYGRSPALRVESVLSYRFVLRFIATNARSAHVVHELRMHHVEEKKGKVIFSSLSYIVKRRLGARHPRTPFNLHLLRRFF